MIIGKFTRTTDGYVGSIETMTLSVSSVKFEPVTDRKNEDTPDFRVTANYRDIGAAWIRTTDADKEYLSVEIDDPAFAKPINCALFEASNGNGHVLTWTRQRSRR
jgi:uncharacterized protein (DUF736 family)